MNLARDLQIRIRTTNSNSSYEDSLMKFSNSLREDQLTFYETLIRIIPPRNQSDRTSFRRVATWLVKQCENGGNKFELFGRVLDFAKEAANPRSRNPAAVFMSILKKEMEYQK